MELLKKGDKVKINPKYNNPYLKYLLDIVFTIEDYDKNYELYKVIYNDTTIYFGPDQLIKVDTKENVASNNINASMNIYDNKIIVNVYNQKFKINRFKDETDNEMLDRAFQLLKTQYDKQTKINNTFPKYGDTYYKFVSFSPEEEAAEKNIVKMIFNPMCVECLIDKRLNNIAATKEELNLRKEEIYNNFYTFLKGDSKDGKR